MDQKNKSFQVRKPVLLSSDLILILFKLQSSAEDFPELLPDSQSWRNSEIFHTVTLFIYIFLYILFSDFAPGVSFLC